MHSVWSSTSRARLGEALTKFETIKRAGSPHTKGKDKLKNANFSLPLSGSALEWQDFWGTLLGWAYRQDAASDFKAVLANTIEQLDELAEKAEAKVRGKYDAKLKKSSTEIAKVDLAHVAAAAGPKKDGLAGQLESLRAARDGLLKEQSDELTALEARFDKMRETRGEMDAQKAAKVAKAKAAVEALHTRAAPAGGTSAEDATRALKEVSDRAAMHAAQAAHEAEAAQEAAEFAEALDEF